MTKSISFTEEEFPLLNKMVRLFQDVKELVLTAEELEENQKAYPQILIEYRNALDHLFRVLADKLDLNETTNPPDHSKKSLDKAFGHIYRAGYDALDLLDIEYYRKIQEILKGKSNRTLTQIFPKYYKEIKPRIEDIKMEIAKLRHKKDLDNESNQTEKLFENFQKYKDHVTELSNLYKDVRTIQPSLEEFEHKNRKEKWLRLIIGIIIGTVTTLVPALIIYFLPK